MYHPYEHTISFISEGITKIEVPYGYLVMNYDNFKYLPPVVIEDYINNVIKNTGCYNLDNRINNFHK